MIKVNRQNTDLSDIMFATTEMTSCADASITYLIGLMHSRGRATSFRPCCFSTLRAWHQLFRSEPSRRKLQVDQWVL